MRKFEFKGTLPVSKSLLNRALIALSYNSDFKLIGDSSCDDVQLMQRGLIDLLSGKQVNCGHAGTVLRFLALRASRIPGEHILRGSERLFSRPQEELLPIFGQLGVDAHFSASSLKIVSRGWRLAVDGLQINAERSSQFASGVILNAWGLKFPLHLHISRRVVSEGYLQMTLKLMRQLGMRIEENGVEFFIPANQKISAHEYEAEIDLSSAFAVAALAVVGGEAVIQKFPQPSLQPDLIFVQILKNMGVDVRFFADERELLVKQTHVLRGVKVNLTSSPDLLPILGVLCAIAQSPSEITGVGHLKYKESSRLEKTKELLKLMGAQVEVSDSSLRVTPAGVRPIYASVVTFDVDQDHRMAMAATIAARAGFLIQPSDMLTVTKSFPEFIEISRRDF